MLDGDVRLRSAATWVHTERMRIVSGGQTGVDRAALDAAIERGLAYGGWCPAGGWAEDRPEPPGLLADYPALRETPSSDPAVRTRLNVRDSDVTLVVVRSDGIASPGTRTTLAQAERLGRPHLVTAGTPEQVTAWLDALGPVGTLNVAGPRESEQPGVYALTRRLLDRVLSGEPRSPHQQP